MNRTITAIVLIVLAVGIYITFTQGEITAGNNVQAVNSQYQTAINNAEQLVQKREQVLQAYNNISANDRDRLAKMLPDSVDNIRLMIDLNNVALQHGFSLQGIKAEVPSDASNPSSPASGSSGGSNIASSTLSTVQVSFSVTAPYEQFISFLQDLEANLRIMDLTQLSMTANDTGTYTFNVQLTTYWLKQ